MKFLVTYFRKIASGQEEWREKMKYRLLVFACTAVHTLLIFLFSYMQIPPLVVFNIFSVASYLFCIWLLTKEAYLRIFLITYFEIIFHSLIATIFTGWQFGFPLYIIALVPLSYYICYTIKADYRRLFTATLLALFAFVCFIGCRILSSYITPSYQSDSDIFMLVIYSFNTICAFVLLLAFSLIFLLEMQSMTLKLERQNTALEELANIDPLTGLYNRRSMHKFLSLSVEENKDFSLIMCDIDDFKKINDTYGHEFGDIVLKGVSAIIKEQIAEGDYACRWGGEEMLILCNRPLTEEVRRTAEAIRRNIAEKNFDYHGTAIHCTLTLGLAAHEANQKIEKTISKADMKLYQGKRDGKNVVVV